MVTPYATVALFERFGLHGVLGMVGVVLIAMYLPIFDLAGKIKGD